MIKFSTLALSLVSILIIIPFHAHGCEIENRKCVLNMLQNSAAEIDKQSWKDQTYRELAKTLAFDGDLDGALEIFKKIQTPDTKAMTIRGIGMATADRNLNQTQYDDIFAKLRTASTTIDHPPSYAIALTYIAMSQAFAGDDTGAWETAAAMENDALRNKAYGETAEIQAEQGKFTEAMKSIKFIGSESFRNKAYELVSKILAEGKYLQPALESAQKITNPYKRASAIQFVLDAQRPREVARR